MIKIRMSRISLDREVLKKNQFPCKICSKNTNYTSDAKNYRFSFYFFENSGKSRNILKHRPYLTELIFMQRFRAHAT